MNPSEKNEADLLLAQHRVRVLFSDNHLLVVHKPAGLSTQSDGRTQDLLSVCREYVRLRFQKPGKAFLGLVHRLDRPVEGLVVFARTSKAAARLSEQFRNRTVRKVYLALLEGSVPDDAGTWTDTLARQKKADQPGRKAGRKAEKEGDAESDGQAARLEFHTIHRRDGKTLLEIILYTGRLHQIRFQCASRGFPIEGDSEYGARGRAWADQKSAHFRSSPSDRSKAKSIALAAVELGFEHPVTGESLTFRLEPLPEWARAGV